MFEFAGQVLPEDIKLTLDEYAYKGVPTGDFLRAVLSNDLFEAVGRADFSNLKRLGVIVCYIYNELPKSCWGSPEVVKEHLERFRNK